MGSIRRPDIPESVKRLVRYRCGFGCVICGSPLVDYDHIDGWAETGEHEPRRITLLCPSHHAEKTRGLLDKKAVEASNASPANIRTGRTSPFRIRPELGPVELYVGSNVMLTTLRAGGPPVSALMVDGESLLQMRADGDALLVSARVSDPAGNDLLIVSDNSIEFAATGACDARVQGRCFSVSRGPGGTALELEFTPPSSVRIVRARLWHHGVRVEITRAGEFTINYVAQILFSGCTFQNIDAAVLVGSAPRPMSAAIAFPTPPRMAWGARGVIEA